MQDVIKFWEKGLQVITDASVPKHLGKGTSVAKELPALGEAKSVVKQDPQTLEEANKVVKQELILTPELPADWEEDLPCWVVDSNPKESNLLGPVKEEFSFAGLPGINFNEVAAMPTSVNESPVFSEPVPTRLRFPPFLQLHQKN